jgi:hypothetical protein
LGAGITAERHRGQICRSARSFAPQDRHTIAEDAEASSGNKCIIVTTDCRDGLTSPL